MRDDKTTAVVETLNGKRRNYLLIAQSPLCPIINNDKLMISGFHKRLGVVSLGC